MKPPAWRFEREIYPHVFRLQTRYRDEDNLRHINNIAVAGYYDEARSRFTHGLFARLGDASKVRIVTADSHVHYLAEVFHPDEVEIRTGILRIGNASYQIGQALFQKGRCAGVCTTTFVFTADGGSAPIPDRLRSMLEEFLVRAPVEVA